MTGQNNDIEILWTSVFTCKRLKQDEEDLLNNREDVRNVKWHLK